MIDIKNSPFTIRYIYKSNGGKHSALNIAFDNILYEWFYIVDSDDWLDSKCLELLSDEVKGLSADYNSISILRTYENGSVIGDEFPEHIDSYIDRINAFVKGDKADVIRKSSVNAFRFPVYPDEKFMAESPFFIYLGKAGKTKFINYKGYFCEYLNDGLSDNSVRNRMLCPKSTLYVYRCQYSELDSRVLRARAAINWWRFRLFKNIAKESRCLLYICR